VTDLVPQTVEDNAKRKLITQAEIDQAEIESSRAPLMEHLVELRSRMIIMVLGFAAAFIICWIFANAIYTFLLTPFQTASDLYELQLHGGGKGGAFDLILVLFGLKTAPAVQGLKLISTGAMEFFFTKMRMAMFGAIILAFPVIAWQLYRFVAPGLYRRERHAFLPFLVAAPTLFILGMALVYYLILPMVLWFSLSQQIVGTTGVSVQLVPRVSEYLDLITKLMLAFGLCFQLPVIVTLLGLAGIIKARMLIDFWRYAFLGIAVVAAIVTPPDPISMCLLMVPILLLYAVSILCVQLIEINRKSKA
jgi:sec-independent protein translocase protein TatC